MPTTTIAVTAAIIASEQAQQAKRAACQIVIEGYDARKATIEQAQSYASCIQLVHPEPLHPDEIFAGKGLFIMFLLGIVLGINQQKREGYTSDFFDYFTAGVMGGIGTAGASIILFGTVAGIFWLFS